MRYHDVEKKYGVALLRRRTYPHTTAHEKTMRHSVAKSAYGCTTWQYKKLLNQCNITRYIHLDQWIFSFTVSNALFSRHKTISASFMADVFLSVINYKSSVKTTTKFVEQCVLVNNWESLSILDTIPSNIQRMLDKLLLRETINVVRSR